MGRKFLFRHPSAGILAVFVLLVFLGSGMIAQEEKDQKDEEVEHRVQDIEQKLVDNSYTYFCDKIIDNDELLREATIIFEGKTATAYSRVIYVANCAGDIDLLRNDIPNGDYINGLQEHYDHLPPSYIKISHLDKRTKKFVLFQKNKILVNLYIFRPIMYKNTYYILYYILFGRDFKIYYGISLDDDYNVIDYCTGNYSF